MHPRPLLLSCLAAAASLLTASGPARADDTIRTPGDHPSYRLEGEPHLLVGWGSSFGVGGAGLGGRISIPIVDNGFVQTINNSVAITFGMDFVHYGGCRDGACGANYLVFPVAMQWNFYVHEYWSVFAEPGLQLYRGFFDNCTVVGCSNPAETGATPALYLGGRYYFSSRAALTMRIGYPTFSVGLSFF